MSIRSFFKTHEDWVLVFSAIVLVSIVVLFFAWGTTFLAENVGKALEAPSTQAENADFHVEAAGRLDFRGLSGF